MKKERISSAGGAALIGGLLGFGPGEVTFPSMSDLLNGRKLIGFESSRPIKDVQYFFAIGEEVITDLGDKGIVTALMTERHCNKYFVRTSNLETWYEERELKKTPEQAKIEEEERNEKIRKYQIERLSNKNFSDNVVTEDLETLMEEAVKKSSVYVHELEAMDPKDLEAKFKDTVLKRFGMNGFSAEDSSTDKDD